MNARSLLIPFVLTALVAGGCMHAASLNGLRHDIEAEVDGARFESEMQLTLGRISLGLRFAVRLPTVRKVSSRLRKSLTGFAACRARSAAIAEYFPVVSRDPSQRTTQPWSSKGVWRTQWVPKLSSSPSTVVMSAPSASIASVGASTRCAESVQDRSWWPAKPGSKTPPWR